MAAAQAAMVAAEVTEAAADRSVHPKAATGQMSGQCFMAALLAHTRARDLADERQRPTHDECIAERKQLKLTATAWDEGDEQMDAVTAMNIGYVAIDAARPYFAIYRSHRWSGPEDPARMYAVLRVGLIGRRHTEPFPTRGGARCGLVTRAEACQMLEQRGFTHRTLARGLDLGYIG